MTAPHRSCLLRRIDGPTFFACQAVSLLVQRVRPRHCLGDPRATPRLVSTPDCEQILATRLDFRKKRELTRRGAGAQSAWPTLPSYQCAVRLAKCALAKPPMQSLGARGPSAFCKCPPPSTSMRSPSCPPRPLVAQRASALACSCCCSCSCSWHSRRAL